MKKKLLEALKTKFVGVDEAILERIATKKTEGVTDESQITGIVDGINFQDVVKSYGDYRANEANVSSIKNYEEKHGLKDGKPITAGGEDKDPEEYLTGYKQHLITKGLKPAEDNGSQASDSQVQDAVAADWLKSLGVPEQNV